MYVSTYRVDQYICICLQGVAKSQHNMHIMHNIILS